MKFISSFNCATIISTLGIILVFCLSQSAAASCKQYGHSCWGGHGKRGISEKFQAIDDNWFLSKLAQRNLRKVPSDMGLVFNRPSIEAIKEAAMMRQLGRGIPNNFESSSERRDFLQGNLESDNYEDKPVRDGNVQDILDLSDSAALPEKFDLLQILKNSNPVQQ